MNDIKAVISCAMGLLNYRITFAPYSFTFLQFWTAVAILGLIVWFFSKIFD